MAIHRHESAVTIRTTLNGMSINEMIRTHGAKRSEIMTIIDLQLVRFLKSINISQPLTQFQQQEIVLTLVERYPHETLNDFLLMFKMVRHGHFGPIYNRLDITVISEYMNKYLETKSFERENAPKHIVTPEQRGQYATTEEFLAAKEKWYLERIGLFNKLNEIDEKFKRQKRRGVLGLMPDDPKKEMEYQRIKDAATQKWLSDLKNINQHPINNDTPGGGQMVEDDPGTTHGDISVSNNRGGDNDDAIPRAGSEHSEQNNDVSQ